MRDWTPRFFSQTWRWWRPTRSSTSTDQGLRIYSIAFSRRCDLTVRLQLHALAYNLGNFLRTLATPEPIKDWSLTTLKEKLIKIGAKVVSHGRYVAFQMAEVGAPRRREEEIGKCRITSEQPCCTRDEGRPLGLGLQDQGPNRHKPLQNNGWGGER